MEKELIKFKRRCHPGLSDVFRYLQERHGKSCGAPWIPRWGFEICGLCGFPRDFHFFPRHRYYNTEHCPASIRRVYDGRYYCLVRGYRQRKSDTFTSSTNGATEGLLALMRLHGIETKDE